MAKIEDVLATVDEIKANTYDDNVKILWLSELDGQIFNEIILTHEHDEIEPFEGYTDADLGTELIAPFPYDKLYRNYIFAKIDESNGETDRYQNSAAIFNASYKDYYDWYNRTHMPIAKPLRIL